MCATQQDLLRDFNRTQPWMITETPAGASAANAVSTLRVKLVGTPTERLDHPQTPGHGLGNTLRQTHAAAASRTNAAPTEPAHDSQTNWRTVRWRNIAGVVDGTPHSAARVCATPQAAVDPALLAISLAHTLPVMRVAAQPNVAAPALRVAAPEPLRLRIEIPGATPAAQRTQPPPLPRAADVCARGPRPGHRKRHARGPLARAWAFWLRQPPHIAVATAAGVSLGSVIAVAWLMP